MSASIMDTACAILEATRDGDDLAPLDLKLVELAVNGQLNEHGEVAFYALADKAQKGYTKPWYWGVEHLTRDHRGYVYWRGKQIEHYSFHDAEEERVAAERLGRACRDIEARGDVVSTAAWFAWSEEDRKGGTER